MTLSNFCEDPIAFVVGHVEKCVREHPRNRFTELDGSPIFGPPLVGFADGDDPLFMDYKRIIGPWHLTPREVLEKVQAGQEPSEKRSLARVSVISWVLPISRETRVSNRRENKEPSRRWAHTRYFGEEFNDSLRHYLVDLLTQAGLVACAPASSSFFEKQIDPAQKVFTSNWSERHIAYAAGLGTFSLNDGFITEKGMAMRCGSVVANVTLAPTPRRSENHRSNCLFFRGYNCHKCIERCPAGAITTDGHDKTKCHAYMQSYWDRLDQEYQVGIVGCGLCQTGVPCEAMIPAARPRPPSRATSVSEGEGDNSNRK